MIDAKRLSQEIFLCGKGGGSLHEASFKPLVLREDFPNAITPMTQMSGPGRSQTSTDRVSRSATDFASYATAIEQLVLYIEMKACHDRTALALVGFS